MSEIIRNKSRKRLITGIAAGVVAIAAVAGGIAYKLHLDEQERQAVLALCKDATSEHEAAVKKAEKELAEVKKLLAASTDEAIQKEVAGATAYSARPEVKEDKKAKVKARKSGKQLVSDAQGAEKQLTELSKQAQKCGSREDAKTVAAATKKLGAATSESVTARKELSTDVAAFKAEEQARIQAEAAAKAEAERIAAEQAAAAQASYSGGSYQGGYSSGNNSGGYSGGSVSGGAAPTVSMCSIDPDGLMCAGERGAPSGVRDGLRPY